MLNFISFEGRKMSNQIPQGHPGSTTQVAAAFASALIFLAGFADPKNPIKLGFAVLAEMVVLGVIESQRKAIENLAITHGDRGGRG
jgi:hypothetical protein